MAGNVVNLNKFKKKKARDQKARDAAANRVKHGRTKAQKEREHADKVRAERMLAGKRLEKQTRFPPPTARLSFRTWTEADEDAAMSLWGDPRVTALFDARGAWDREAVRARLSVEIATEAQSGVQYWPILSTATGELVGCAGLRRTSESDDVLELGFHLCAHAWGKGLATEAARAVARFAFDALGASALVAGHNPANEASSRVLAKLGFRHTHDELYAPTGLMHPTYRLEPDDLTS